MKPTTALEASHHTFNELVHENQQLLDQLAAAQAEIENIKTVLTPLRHHAFVKEILDGIDKHDTTALDVAISAAQQPLVELLRRCRNRVVFANDKLRDEIDAQLAKVKEGK